jgi:cytochrome c biogenesis protein CcmG, thiol:disulfide interchange protein DsbE
MTHGPRYALLLGCFAALAAFHAATAKDALVGAPAPSFQVTTFDGKKLTLADFKGEVLVINFWATWCGPCKQELPMLDKYYRARQDVGLRVLAVTTEDSLPPSQLQNLASVLTIPMVRRFKGDYGPLKAVPTNYVIDRSGVLRYAKAAALTLDDMNDILVPLLSETGLDKN